MYWASSVSSAAEQHLPDLECIGGTARAAANTARVNVEINLGGIKDEQTCADLAAEADKVDDIAARAEQVILTSGGRSI